MSRRVITLNRQIVAAMAIGVATLMAAASALTLFKIPHSFLIYFSLPLPFLFLVLVWQSFRRLAGVSGQEEPVFQNGRVFGTVREAICLLASMGMCGMGIALFVGIILGRGLSR